MTLYDLIASLASEQATSGDYSAVAAVLNAPTVEKRDVTEYTAAYLVKVLGVDSYRILSGSLAAVGAQDPLVKDMQAKLNSTGLDFSDDLTQAMVDQLGAVAGWTPQLITAIKEIGRWTESPYAAIAPGETVTAEQCEAAWIKSYLADWLENTRGNAIGKIQSGEITTLDSLKGFLVN